MIWIWIVAGGGNRISWSCISGINNLSKIVSAVGMLPHVSVMNDAVIGMGTFSGIMIFFRLRDDMVVMSRSRKRRVKDTGVSYIRRGSW